MKKDNLIIDRPWWKLSDQDLQKMAGYLLIPAVFTYAMLPGLTAGLPEWAKEVLQAPLVRVAPSTSGPQALWSLDELNQFSREALFGRANATTTTGNLQNLTYNYDPVGNITQILDTSIMPTAKTSTYGYDDRNFLTSVSTSGFSQGDYTQTYLYDSLGNLAYKSDIGTINHNGLGLPGPHAITSIVSDNYTYDLNGNLLNDGDNTYTWTIKNELESVTNAQGTTTYVYDAFSRKAKSIFTPVATAENPSPTPQTTIYVGDYMEVRPDGPVYYVYANGERVASYTLYEGGMWRYYTNDHLSGTSLVTDENGEVVQVLDYEPYGEQTLNLAYGTQGSPYSFTGKELDPSTGLYYYEARWYDPETGHFISTDPLSRMLLPQTNSQSNPGPIFSVRQLLENPQRWNAYAYAGGNPVNYTDPSGLGFETLWDAANVVYDMIQKDWESLKWDLVAVAVPFLPAGFTKTDDVAKWADDIIKFVVKSAKFDEKVLKEAFEASIKQMNEKGVAIAGAGTKKEFRNAGKFVAKYGGDASDYAKMTSTSYTLPDGRKFQTHWVENIKTGERYNMKTKITKS